MPPPLLSLLAAAVGLSVLIERLAPQYSLGNALNSFLLFSSLFISYAAFNVVLYPRFLSPLRHLPLAPGGHWFFGHTRRIMRESSGAPMRDWTNSVANEGLIRYSFFLSERLLVTTPSALGEVLVSKNYHFEKPGHVRTGLGPIVGIGVLLAEGDEHKVQRKNLSPAFSYRAVKNHHALFWKKSRELIDCVSHAVKARKTDAEESSDKDTPSPKHEPGAIDVGASGMGQDFKSLHDPSNKLYQTYQDIFRSGGRVDFFLRLLGLLVPFAIVKRIPNKRNLEMQASTEYIKQTCRDLVAKKRQAIAEKGEAEVDVLSVALESGAFEDENLVNQMMTFLVAGHETTATAMIWAIYMLSIHPDVQQKLREEVRAQISSPNDDIVAGDIDNCQYLQAVCSEVLRLWPPVGMTMRIAVCDTSIGGVFVPKGTTVVLSPWAINTSRALWGDDAEEFKPERWIDADGKANNKGGAQSNYSSLTFLHGPRSCIGERFARSEFSCLLAAWAGRFETSLEEGSPLNDGKPDVQGGVTAKPRGGLWCQLNEVPGW